MTLPTGEHRGLLECEHDDGTGAPRRRVANHPVGRTIRLTTADKCPSFLAMPDAESTDQDALVTSLNVRERLVEALTSI